MKNHLMGMEGPLMDNKHLWTFLCLIGICAAYNSDITMFFTDRMTADRFPMENVFYYF